MTIGRFIREIFSENPTRELLHPPPPVPARDPKNRKALKKFNDIAVFGADPGFLPGEGAKGLMTLGRYMGWG